VHFVIPETNAGPIMMQGAVVVANGDTPETLSQRILGIAPQPGEARLRRPRE
jgi:phosphoribosylglycinamide formyltransferase-1